MFDKSRIKQKRKRPYSTLKLYPPRPPQAVGCCYSPSSDIVEPLDFFLPQEIQKKTFLIHQVLSFEQTIIVSITEQKSIQ